MPTTTSRDDAQIRERIDASARAIRTKDIDALMAHYALVIHEHVSMPFANRETMVAALASSGR